MGKTTPAEAAEDKGEQMITREWLKENWELVKAFKEGAIIQFWSDKDEKWYHYDDKLLDSADRLRIKPEVNETFIPFTLNTAYHCRLIGQMLSDGCERRQIKALAIGGVYLYPSRVGDVYFETYLSLVNSYTFLETGEPVGLPREKTFNTEKDGFNCVKCGTKWRGGNATSGHIPNYKDGQWSCPGCGRKLFVKEYTDGSRFFGVQL